MSQNFWFLHLPLPHTKPESISCSRTSIQREQLATKSALEGKHIGITQGWRFHEFLKSSKISQGLCPRPIFCERLYNTKAHSQRVHTCNQCLLQLGQSVRTFFCLPRWRCWSGLCRRWVIQTWRTLSRRSTLRTRSSLLPALTVLPCTRKCLSSDGHKKEEGLSEKCFDWWFYLAFTMWTRSSLIPGKKPWSNPGSEHEFLRAFIFFSSHVFFFLFVFCVVVSLSTRTSSKISPKPLRISALKYRKQRNETQRPDFDFVSPRPMAISLQSKRSRENQLRTMRAFLFILFRDRLVVNTTNNLRHRQEHQLQTRRGY